MITEFEYVTVIQENGRKLTKQEAGFVTPDKKVTNIEDLAKEKDRYCCYQCARYDHKTDKCGIILESEGEIGPLSCCNDFIEPGKQGVIYPGALDSETTTIVLHGGIRVIVNRKKLLEDYVNLKSGVSGSGDERGHKSKETEDLLEGNKYKKRKKKKKYSNSCIII